MALRGPRLDVPMAPNSMFGQLPVAVHRQQMRTVEGTPSAHSNVGLVSSSSTLGLFRTVDQLLTLRPSKRAAVSTCS
jgi:hypothetical protein